MILVKQSVREKVRENVKQKRIEEGVLYHSYTLGFLFTRPHALSLQRDLITGNQGRTPLLGTYPSPGRAHVLEAMWGLRIYMNYNHIV